MSDNIHIINLSSYQTPLIQESKRDNWVEFGEDNNYFQYLIDRYTYSTTNNAIINNISRLVYGRGLSALDASKKPNEWAQLMTIFNSDCIKKMIVDRKMLGQFAIQVHYSKDHKSILKAYHMPVNLLRAEKCNKDGEVEGYYYSDNWQDVKKYAPKRIPAYGFSNEQIEILFVKPYTVGMKYYAYPDYQGAIPYAKLEEEIADYLINEVQHGFSGTKVINFNNGIPTEEQQSIITNKVNAQLTGSKGLRTIVAFNASETSKTTVDDIPLNDAPEHYSYLSEECLRKIMLGHNVTSPLLFGIATSTGFSSNADELRNSTILYENMVIKPLQDELIEAIDLILGYNGISLKLYFVKLNPLDAAGDLTMEGLNKQLVDSISNLSPLVANKVLESLTPNEIRGIVGLKPESGGSDLDPELLSSQSNPLIELGEDESKDWLLIDEFEVDYDTDEKENDILNGEVKQSLLSKVVNLVSTGSAFPNSKSEQDANIEGIKFITRYVYDGRATEKTRPFCAQMVRANKIYRKEDILRMGNNVVNAGWGPRGADTYSIWLYKGGGNCHHRWLKRVYASFEGVGIDVNSPRATQVAVKKAEKLGYVIKNPVLVGRRPIDMENRGFLPKD
jgi:hypothetical protein